MRQEERRLGGYEGTPNIKRTLARIAVGVFAVALLGYAGFQARAILAGPSIALDTPPDGLLATDPLIPIEGTILRAKDTRLNDRPIFIDPKGRFSERLLLSEGLNILTVAATDVQGRTSRVVRSVYLAPTAHSATSSTETSDERQATTSDLIPDP